VTAIDIEVRATGPRTTIALVGELDRAGCRALRGCFQVLEPQVRSVVLDLRDLTFIDGAGIATLVDLSAELEVGLRRLEVVGLGGQVQRVLELTGAASALGIVEP
jgi:anti-anti-sigma factor